MSAKLKKSLFTLCLTLLLALLLTACGGAADATSLPVGMANPASVYCEEQGGTLEIRTDSDGGEYGVCLFEDGSECEEWAFFRGECQPGDRFNESPPVGMANPASVYCEEQGGTLEIRTDSGGGEYGVCLFEDGSECEEWAFFRGECLPENGGESGLPAPPPDYTNGEYGFYIREAGEWVIEEGDHQVSFLHPDGYRLFVGFKWADEEIEPFLTDLPAGEIFATGGEIDLLGTPVSKWVLSFEGRNKIFFYGSLIEIEDLQLVIWLDQVLPEGADYKETSISAEIQAQADSILSTFELASGATPPVVVQPMGE